MFSERLPKIKQFLPRKCRPSQMGMLIRLMACFIQHTGKMTASQAAGAVRSATRHRANVGRGLARESSWHDGILLNRLARRILKSEPKRQGRWLLILDQTQCGQQGQQTENTFSRANYRPRSKKSGRKQLKTARHSCHSFVIALIITPRGCRVPLTKSYYTRDYAQAQGLPFQTQTELAAMLIRCAPIPEGADVLVLGDTAFEAKSVRAACDQRGYEWIVPLNPERVLEGSLPRRKVASLAKDFEVSQWTHHRFVASAGPWAAQQRVSPCRRGSVQHTRSYYAHRERLRIRHVGEVVVIFSVKRQPRKRVTRTDKILITNDRKLSAKAVLQAYSLRWQIEQFFREIKSTLGFDAYSFREYWKVDGWVNVCLLTFLYLEWLRYEKVRHGSAKARQWWSDQRTHGLCCAVRQRMEVDDLRRYTQWSRTRWGQRQLRRTLKHAYPREYQEML